MLTNETVALTPNAMAVMVHVISLPSSVASLGSSTSGRLLPLI